MARWSGGESPVSTKSTIALGSTVGLSGAAGLLGISSQASPLFGLLGVCGALLGLAMIASPTFAYLMVCFTIPLERIGRLTNDFDSYTISLSRIFGFLALGTFLVHAVMKRWKIRFGVAFWLYAGYAAIAAASIIYASVQKDAIRDEFRIIGNLLFFFLIVNVVRTFDLVRAGIVSWLLISVAVGVYSMYDYHLGHNEDIEEADMGTTANRYSSVVADDSEGKVLGKKVKRAFGTTSHPTLFGLNMAMTIPFFGFMMRRGSILVKCLWFGGLLIVCYNVVLSNTRACLLVALLSLGLGALRGLWRLDAKTVVAAILLAGCILPFMPEDIWERALDFKMYSSTKSDSIRVRFKYWEKSWELIQENWATGIGVGDQTTIVKRVTDELAGRITPDGLKASAHNEFIWTFVEVGLFGWLFHFGFVGYCLWASFKAASYYRRWKDTEDEYWCLVACQIPLIGVLFFGLQTEVFHFALKGWWLTAALSCVLLDMARKRAANRLSTEAEQV